MANTPDISKSSSVMPYVWSMLILFLLGVILIGIILYLRPLMDPVLVTINVMGFVISVGAGISAVIKGQESLNKSQETHLTVNSQLTAWKTEYAALKHAEGMLAGVAGEQDRIVEQKRAAALGGKEVLPVAAPNVPPVEVTIKDQVDPLPVVLKK